MPQALAVLPDGSFLLGGVGRAVAVRIVGHPLLADLAPARRARRIAAGLVRPRRRPAPRARSGCSTARRAGCCSSAEPTASIDDGPAAEASRALGEPPPDAWTSGIAPPSSGPAPWPSTPTMPLEAARFAVAPRPRRGAGRRGSRGRGRRDDAARPRARRGRRRGGPRRRPARGARRWLRASRRSTSPGPGATVIRATRRPADCWRAHRPAPRAARRRTPKPDAPRSPPSRLVGSEGGRTHRAGSRGSRCGHPRTRTSPGCASPSRSPAGPRCRRSRTSARWRRRGARRRARARPRGRAGVAAGGPPGCGLDAVGARHRGHGARRSGWTWR